MVSADKEQRYAMTFIIAQFIFFYKGYLSMFFFYLFYLSVCIEFFIENRSKTSLLPRWLAPGHEYADYAVGVPV